MWNFGNWGNLGSWGHFGQLIDMRKNWGNFGGLWGSTGQQPTAPAPTPVSPDREPVINQYEAYAKVCEKILADIPSYDLGTSNLTTALNGRKGNCCTISMYSKIACDLLGIPCDIIFAVAGTGLDMHIWNRVILDGKKYWSDITMTQMAREQGQGWGEWQKFFDQPSDLQKHYDSFFILGIDGSIKKLDWLDLESGCSNAGWSIAASMTAQIVQSEYVACKDRVYQALKEIGVIG